MVGARAPRARRGALWGALALLIACGAPETVSLGPDAAPFGDASDVGADAAEADADATPCGSGTEPPPDGDCGAQPRAGADAATSDGGEVADAAAPDVPDAAPPAPDAAPCPAGVGPRPGGGCETPPPEPPVDPPRAVTPQRLLDGPVAFAAALPGGGFLADTPAGLVRVAREGAAPETLGGDAGALRAAAPEVDLVAGDAGLFVIRDGALVRSPLDAHVRAVVALRTHPEGDLWLGAADGLHRWRAGRLHAVRAGGLPVADARFALGPHLESDAALWVAAGDAVYAIADCAPDACPGGGLRAWPVREGAGAVAALAVDGAGQAWVVVDGALYRAADPDPIPLPVAVRDLAAAPGVPDLWLAAADGLWQARDGRFRPVEGVPPPATLAPDAGGAVLVASPEGLFRVHPGRHLDVAGVRDGEALAAAAVLEVRPSEPENVDAVTLSLDGAAPFALAAGWTWALDPAALGDGPHALEIAVTWRDGERARARRRFSVRLVGPPTWEADVQPLYAAHCDACHGPRGYAHRLETSASWRAEIDRILAAVRARRMPLAPNPPLGAADIDRIEAWRAAGFPESWP